MNDEQLHELFDFSLMILRIYKNPGILLLVVGKLLAYLLWQRSNYCPFQEGKRPV